MKRYILRRLLWLPVLIFAVSFVTFTLGRIAPGDPVRVMMGNKYNEITAANIRKEFGLDRLCDSWKSASDDPETAARQLFEAVAEHPDSYPQTDDRTLVIMSK